MEGGKNRGCGPIYWSLYGGKRSLSNVIKLCKSPGKQGIAVSNSSKCIKGLTFERNLSWNKLDLTTDLIKKKKKRQI